VSAIYSELCLALPSRRVVATSVRLRGTWLGWINSPGKMAHTAPTSQRCKGWPRKCAKLRWTSRQICGVGRNILGNITPPAKSCRPGRSLAPPRSGFCWLLDGRTIIQLWCTQEKGTGSWRDLVSRRRYRRAWFERLKRCFPIGGRSFPTFKQGKYAQARMASDKSGLPNR
jgi:hypothetical protein